MDITDEEFTEEFSSFGVQLDDPDMIDKLKTLCQIYRKDASELVLEWVAYSSTNNCPLNPENVDHMEREKLQKKASRVSKGTPHNKKESSKTYDVTAIDGLMNMSGPAEILLDSYATPGKSSKKRQHTPDHAVNKKLTALGRSPGAAFSPASMSPTSVTPSKKYNGRSNAGEVVVTFGNCDKVSWKSHGSEPGSVEPYLKEAALGKNMKYMFQKLTEKANVLNELTLRMENCLQKHYNIDQLGHVALPIQETVTVVGRVCCDSVGKLNAKSVLLEGSRETSAGKRIPVDLSSVPQFSLFPGQVVAMDGMNSSGQKFAATKVYPSVPLPLPAKKPALQAPLHVVIAAGPFTTSDSMSYEPLADLTRYIENNTPDVLVLLGPFEDAKNPDLEKHMAELNITFEEHFKYHVLDPVVEITKDRTKLVVVPSGRDIHHDNVFPQPPFDLTGNKYSHVHFVSDPSTLNIGGVVFGFTSTDVLFHLGMEETSCPPGSSDRLARLTNHILTQQCYYPLYPPAEELNVDYDQFDLHAKLPVTPHVLVLPSELKHFLKDVNGTCCVNPGRLTKGQVGGTFVRLMVKPGGDNSSQSLVSNIAAEVVRI